MPNRTYNLLIAGFLGVTLSVLAGVSLTLFANWRRTVAVTEVAALKTEKKRIAEELEREIQLLDLVTRRADAESRAGRIAQRRVRNARAQTRIAEEQLSVLQTQVMIVDQSLAKAGRLSASEVRELRTSLTRIASNDSDRAFVPLAQVRLSSDQLSALSSPGANLECIRVLSDELFPADTELELFLMNALLSSERQPDGTDEVLDRVSRARAQGLNSKPSYDKRRYAEKAARAYEKKYQTASDEGKRARLSDKIMEEVRYVIEDGRSSNTRSRSVLLGAKHLADHGGVPAATHFVCENAGGLAKLREKCIFMLWRNQKTTDPQEFCSSKRALLKDLDETSSTKWFEQACN